MKRTPTNRKKINDQLGNPIIIGIVVIWKVVNTAKAVFNVDNYVEYLSIQCDSALRNIVRLYPYDASSEDNEKGKKQIPLRLSSSLWKELAEWAEDDFRSINGQIEFLLTECVRQRKKSKMSKPRE